MRGWPVAVTFLLATVACTDGSAPPAPPAAHSELRLSTARAVHRATALPDGTVLITGGCTRPGCGGFDAGRTAELVAADGTVRTGARMATPRANGTSTLMRDGRVLITGGFPGEGQAPTALAEIYDPDAARFRPVASMTTGRAEHTASLLADGRILVAGGVDATGRAVTTSEIFDPASDTFTRGPELSEPRAAHVAVTVGDVIALVGGTAGHNAVDSTDVYRHGSWAPGPQLLTRRVKLGAAPLPDGRILVVGGSTDTEGRKRLASTELVDLETRSVEAGPRLDQGEYKLDGAVALLPDGRVVVPSGDGLELFDPAASSFTALPATTYPARSFRTVTVVGPERVLVAGGYDDAITPTDEAVIVHIPSPR